MEKHVKQTFQMDTYYHKLNHEFRKSHAISQMIGGHFKKCDIYIIFINSINEKLVATENRLNLELWNRICPSSIDTSELQTLVLVFWSQMYGCAVLAVNFETPMLPSDKQLEQNIL